MKTVFCVNLVAYEEGGPRDLQQHAAVHNLVNEDVGLIPVAMKDEAEEIERRYPDLDISCLDRDAKELIGGPRSLPFIKEMMDYVNQVTADDPDVYWIGILNSDIVLTEFFEASAWMTQEKQHRGALLHRTDIDELGDKPQDKDILHKGIDGFLVTPTTWDNLRHTYPDFVLGEPGWGQGTEHWMQFHGIKHTTWKSHECIHVRHKAFWKRTRTAVGNHNQRLYRQIKLLNKTKGKL